MAKKSPRRPVRSKSEVLINAQGIATPFRLRVDESLQEIAWRWNYALRNRNRWTTRGEAFQRQRADVHELVRRFGLDSTQLNRIADAGLVEVSIPFRREDEGWEYRIFPWEYVLATATSERRYALRRDFTVVRHLRRTERHDARQKGVFLYVESAPARLLSDEYDFSNERSLADAAAKNADLKLEQSFNPTLSELAATVRRLRPKVIHLGGFDTHQARTLLSSGSESDGDEADESHLVDGYVLSDGLDGYHEVRSLDLARALTAGNTAPALISCNFFNSAPRTAALCVAMGAHAAIGFQDTFDDSLAELFFSTLYRAWAISNRSTTSAFRYAWQQVRTQARRITGTGLVLWNADSIAEKARRATAQPISVETIADEWKKISARTVTSDSARHDLVVSVEPLSSLNYSILHNNRPLFKSFKIEKQKNDIGAVDGIDVLVELQVGPNSYPFKVQTSIAATKPSVDVGPEIRVSLTSTLSRAIREAIHTSLFIEVRFETVTLFRQTRNVKLLAVDEWTDTDDDRQWLPSFVLPRDPAVSRIVELATRDLHALTDDPTAGFDGYQSVEEIDAKRRKYESGGVDLQVRAIWSALLHQTPLSYINPPPTFTNSSQRLRSPSDVIEGRMGTCIDLALLVAACLEYVEIYPTIILLSDHAFPCYWRAEEYFERFSLARSIDPRVTKEFVDPQQKHSWSYQKAHFREVLEEIVNGRLVPIEATCLCWRNSFAEACKQGAKNLSRRSRFDSMLDIRAARTDEDWAVTPLPILRVEA